VDHTLFYPDPTQTQQQHQPFIKHLGFGFFKAVDLLLHLFMSFSWINILISKNGDDTMKIVTGHELKQVVK